MNRTIFFPIIFTVILLSGCSTSKLIVSMTEPVLSNGVEALYKETDTEFAREAIAGNLKLLEGFRASDPDNGELNALLSQGYSAYALGYLEDDEPQRARNFYYRSLTYARALFGDIPVLKNGSDATPSEVREAVSSLEREDVDRLFWLGLSWGSYIQLSTSDPAALGDLPKVLAIMDKVIELDETYYFGGAHLFFGAYYATLPPMLGGNPGKSKEHFDRAFEISDGKFLIGKYQFAKSYCYQVQDRELFDQTIAEILAADPHILPGMELPNALAKKKAKRLAADADIMF